MTKAQRRPRRKSTKERDSQCQRVYDAEEVLGLPGQTMPREEVILLVKRVMSSPDVQATWPQTFGKDSLWGDLNLHLKRGGKSACGGVKNVKLPPWGCTPHIVLHEMAHVIHQRQFWQLKEAGHGWRYCSIYLQLVGWFMGREAQVALYRSFKAYRVKFTPPKPKRKLTAEQKAVLAARLRPRASPPDTGVRTAA